MYRNVKTPKKIDLQHQLQSTRIVCKETGLFWCAREHSSSKNAAIPRLLKGVVSFVRKDNKTLFYGYLRSSIRIGTHFWVEFFKKPKIWKLPFHYIFPWIHRKRLFCYGFFHSLWFLLLNILLFLRHTVGIFVESCGTNEKLLIIFIICF